MTTVQWLTVLGVPSIIAFIFQIVFNSLRERRERKIEEKKASEEREKVENSIERKALQAILRDRLLQGYRYFESKGYCPIDEKNNFENMYNCYHALGKNGVMKSVYEKIMALPDKEKTND